MKVLLSWLREFAPFDAAPDEIADALGMLGTPVEEQTNIGHSYEGIVVARVLELRQHPDAKKVQRVVVDAGGAEPVEVWCGAFNMAVGDLVPLATIGTVMPNGMEISRRKILGEASEGMLCSPTELELPGEPTGILVLPPAIAPLGTPLREALAIEADVLYELEVNPNRPDAMSVAGVARDLAAWFKVPFTLPNPTVAEDETPVDQLTSVVVEDEVRCGRFTTRVLRGVTVRPSPAAIARRLTLLGMRPINNVVDVSNYVMLELGQPSHPYDLARVPGGGLRVRRARAGETITTLDDVERSLTDDDLLICDALDAPSGIAGIMGGAASEIDESTRDVLVEMAWFEPMPIAKSSRRLGLRSEASARFEKGCDPEVIGLAHRRFIDLLGDAVTSVARGAVVVDGVLPASGPVRVRTARVNRILGTALDGGTVRTLLEPIGFVSTPAGDDDNDVRIPSWRFDSATEIDVIEEVARHFGYPNIGANMPPAVRFGHLSEHQAERRHVRDVLVGLGLAEAMPTPFLAPDDIRRAGLHDDGITITNPLIADESVLRTSLLPGMLKTIAYNESHRVEHAALFELGHVFRRPATPQPLPDEREHVAAALAGEEAPAAVRLWDALADALAVRDWELRAAELPGLHATRGASILVGGHAVGAVGEVDPGALAAFGISERVAWLEVDLGQLFALPHGERTYRPVSRYPSSDIDLALVTPDAIPAAAVARALRDGAGDLLVALELFDVYRGAGVPDGARSLAYRLRLQASDRTLTDADVAAVRASAIAAAEAVGASLR